MGDSAVILAQIRVAIDCKDFKYIQNTIIVERFADIDSYWELVSMLGRCITLEHSKNSPEFFDTSRDCLMYLISNGNAKELLLALLEQIDETTEDVKFKVYMQLLQITLLKLSVKRSYSLELVLVSLSDHILHLSHLDDGSKVQEENVEMDDDDDDEKEHRKTVSTEEIRISDLIKAYLEFLHPFVSEVSIADRNAFKGDNLLEQITLLVKHLVCIVGQPLINFDLSYCQSEKYCSFTIRSCAEAIVQNITAMRPNIQSLLEDLIHFNTTLERKQKVRQALRQLNPIENDDSEDNGDIENEEIIPVLALSNLSYLLNVEKFGMASFPCVYTDTYLLQFNLSFVSRLLLNNNLYIIQKGVRLLQVTVSKVLPGTLDHIELENPDWFFVLDALTQVMTGCASKKVRQACVRLLPPFIDIFTSKGKYKIFEKIFKTCCHSGVIGYVVQLFKNEIEKELRSSNSSNQFLGASMYKLLREVASLPDGAKTRLLDHSDQLICVLNLIRYLLLSDPPTQNITGIWSWYGKLEQAFLNPLRQCLDITKGTFHMELNDVQHGQTQETTDVEFGINVGGQMLPEMTKAEKINMLNLALRTFDVMELVLCRVSEIADQQRKQLKNAASISCGLVEEEPGKPPERTTDPRGATGKLSHKTTLAESWTQTHTDRVSGRLVRSLIGVRHLTQDAGKSGSVKETPEDTSQPPTQTLQADDEREETEYQTKQRILKAALPFVHTYGWTKHAIAKGAEAEGMPGVAHGLFQRGGVELVFYFYRDCNKRLVEQMSATVRQQQEQKDSTPNISGLIQGSVEQRLRMNIPYMDKWQQAMAIQTLPGNAPEALSNLAALVDDIWHYAGDQSTDFNWYTKRASLAGVYKSTEIYMLQDKSEDFQNTWEFLNRRMGDLKNFGKFSRRVQENSVVISEGLYGMCIMARNILGMNARIR